MYGGARLAGKGGVVGERGALDNRSRPSLWERLKEWRLHASRPGNDDGISLARWQELHAMVQANRPLRVERVDLPGTDLTLRITTRWFPQIPGQISDAPYWSEIWPS